MAELEEETLSEIKLKPYLWSRYKDDIFFLWKHGEEKLKVIEHSNEKHPTTKFTAEWCQTWNNFLDVKVSLIGGKVTADLHVKPTDSYPYLHSYSCRHPYHCKKGIPYSQDLFVLIESAQIENVIILKSG